MKAQAKAVNSGNQFKLFISNITVKHFPNKFFLLGENIPVDLKTPNLTSHLSCHSFKSSFLADNSKLFFLKFKGQFLRTGQRDLWRLQAKGKRSGGAAQNG